MTEWREIVLKVVMEKGEAHHFIACDQCLHPILDTANAVTLWADPIHDNVPERAYTVHRGQCERTVRHRLAKPPGNGQVVAVETWAHLSEVVGSLANSD